MHVDSIALKECRQCGKLLPATAEFFYRCSKVKSGLTAVCKTCRGAYEKEWRKANRARCNARIGSWKKRNKRKVNATNRQWAARNRPQARARRKAADANVRAATFGCPGRLTGADVVAQYAKQVGRCHHCDAKVGLSYHLDHLAPLSKGGSNWPANVVIACARCNLTKAAKLSADLAR